MQNEDDLMKAENLADLQPMIVEDFEKYIEEEDAMILCTATVISDVRGASIEYSMPDGSIIVENHFDLDVDSVVDIARAWAEDSKTIND